MGSCLKCCNDSAFQESKEALDLPEDQQTETYDPANLSCTHDSNMAGYQFTSKVNSPNGTHHAFRLQNDGMIAKRELSPLPDTTDIVNQSQLETKYVKEKNISGLNGVNLLTTQIPSPRKRVVFVSLMSLNAVIDDIPSYILDESLFCFKAERAWFYPSNPTEEKASKQSIRHRVNFNERFLTSLDQKQANNHILWMEDKKSWKDLSNEMTQINDIYFSETDEKQCYQALKLNVSWWMHEFDTKTDGIEALYCPSGDVVVEELLACKLKFNPTMELLFQSNPTLIPMKGFDFEVYINQHYKHDAINPDPNSDAMELVNNASNANLTENNSLHDKKFNMTTIDTSPPKETKEEKLSTVTPFNTNETFENQKLTNSYLQGSESKEQYIKEDDDEHVIERIESNKD